MKQPRQSIFSLLLLLLASTSCASGDKASTECEETLIFHADTDADGYGDPEHVLRGCQPPDGYLIATEDSSLWDCDDANPEVHPLATERCNARDDDCDHEIDELAEDMRRWFLDSDADGHGDPERESVACDAPSGHVADATDCDDSDETVHPKAVELCDGVDSDCDALPDDIDAQDARVWHTDLDEDSFGDAREGLSSCEELEGLILDGSDCDDGDPDVHPGAEEIVANRVDDDCDGIELCWLDADLDGYGRATVIESTSGCEDDGEALNADDCEDRDPLLYPLATSDLAGLDFACLNAGTFTMGSPPDEIGRQHDELQHEVTLTRGFLIGAREVTQAEFELIMGYNPSSQVDCDDCPVENLSWHEAVALANALSEREGLEPCYTCTGEGASLLCRPELDPYECAGFRLPTEAEWEYAARAVSTASFWDGENLRPGTETDCRGELMLDGHRLLDDMAWYCGNAPSGPQPVASLLPNAWGLYDVSGNVYEWCADAYEAYRGDTVDPIGPDSEAHRVQRGGSWCSDAGHLRLAGRRCDNPSECDECVGLRLARSSWKE